MNPSLNPNPGNPYQPTAYAPPSGESPVPAVPLSAADDTKNVNPNSTQNSLQVAEIRDGIVIMNDGTFRTVIMCKAINFDLMSPQEREGVEFAYQGMLNSLYFPIQVFMRSQRIDMRPYLDKLTKIRTEQDNMLLGLLMEDYVTFLGDISQATNIMDKNFYAVVEYPDPDEEDIKSSIEQTKGFFSGAASLLGGKDKTQKRVVVDERALEAAKTELRNRVQALMQGLSDCGVHSIPLDTQELIELYYDVYNPDTATRQQLRDFGELNTPVVTKGTGNAPQPQLDTEMSP